MTEEHDLLLNMYGAFNARDIDTVVAGMHNEVDWPWEGGRLHGRQSVRDYWLRRWRMIDPKVEPVAFDVDPENRIIVRVHQLMCDLDGNFISAGVLEHVYRMQDGLVRSMEMRHADAKHNAPVHGRATEGKKR